MLQDYQEEDAENVSTSLQPSGYESSGLGREDGAILSHDSPIHFQGISAAIPDSVLLDPSSKIVADSSALAYVLETPGEFTLPSGVQTSSDLPDTQVNVDAVFVMDEGIANSASECDTVQPTYLYIVVQASGINLYS